LQTRDSEMGSCELDNIKLASTENGKCRDQTSNYNCFGKINDYTTQKRITGQEYRQLYVGNSIGKLQIQVAS
jgi:hypothetical protein